ncbi:MAG: helix-turn-helix transcriptional regulator [Rouxiella badensis]|uniref:helix-turn-helix transcriptional regulator n=1 Tax=Rouxiella badensis TaxID=1646377 RepID=UPI003C688E52
MSARNFRELGNFLRARRESLLPHDVGLPLGERRRTPGLRREEVAQLAKVGTAWYTWLEQGREVKASAGVLLTLADALRMTETECAHLFALSGRMMPQRLPVNEPPLEAALQRMLDDLSFQPAYITNKRWDIVGWNNAACAVFGDYSLLEGDDRNLLSMLFANQAHRELLVDWAEIAPAALAIFRAETAHCVNEAHFATLIDRLNVKSETFRQLWARQEVLSQLTNIKRIHHPIADAMSFEYHSFLLSDGSARRLTVYSPQEVSRDKLQALLPVQRLNNIMRLEKEHK